MAEFAERLRAVQDFGLKRGTDNSSSGTLSDVANSGTSYIRFTAATQINSFVAGFDAKILVIKNASGGNISIANETGGTAANRIVTGTGAGITLANTATLTLIYDSGASRWSVINGTSTGGGGGSTDLVSANIVSSNLSISIDTTLVKPFTYIDTGITVDGTGNLFSAGYIAGPGTLAVTGIVLS